MTLRLYVYKKNRQKTCADAPMPYAYARAQTGSPDFTTMMKSIAIAYGSATKNTATSINEYFAVMVEGTRRRLTLQDTDLTKRKSWNVLLLVIVISSNILFLLKMLYQIIFRSHRI